MNDRRADEATGEHKAVLLGDPAALGMKVPEDQRDATAALPARPVLRRLRARTRTVPRLLGRPLARHGDTANRPMAGHPQSVHGGDLSATDFVYVWTDGVHLRIRLEEAKAAGQGLMGVRTDGAKELIAMTVIPRVDLHHGPVENEGHQGGRQPGSRPRHSLQLVMAFKLIESAQAHRRAVNAPHLVALVGAGACFERGHLVERPEEAAA